MNPAPGAVIFEGLHLVSRQHRSNSDNSSAHALGARHDLSAFPPEVSSVEQPQQGPEVLDSPHMGQDGLEPVTADDADKRRPWYMSKRLYLTLFVAVLVAAAVGGGIGGTRGNGSGV